MYMYKLPTKIKTSKQFQEKSDTTITFFSLSPPPPLPQPFFSAYWQQQQTILSMTVSYKDIM